MRILLIGLVLMLVGCTYGGTKIDTKLDDGSSELCSATYMSFFKSVEAADISGCGAGAKVQGSSTDAIAYDFMKFLVERGKVK